LKFDFIEDFSTYRNQRLYVLTPGRIEMYDLNDLSYEGYLSLPDSSYIYCKVGGMDENLVAFMAIRDGRDYSGEYDFEERKFYFPADGVMQGSDAALKKVLSRSGYFYSEDHTFDYFSNSGDIFRMEDFYFLSYQWDFKHKEPLNVCVSNVQMMSRKLFMQIETDKGDYCLITTLDEKDYPRSTKLFLNSNTPCFPVGVFYNGKNHYLCDSKDIGRYISKELLDDEGKQLVDSLQSVSRNVIIQYHLR